MLFSSLLLTSTFFSSGFPTTSDSKAVCRVYLNANFYEEGVLARPCIRNMRARQAMVKMDPLNIKLNCTATAKRNCWGRNKLINFRYVNCKFILLVAVVFYWSCGMWTSLKLKILLKHVRIEDKRSIEPEERRRRSNGSKEERTEDAHKSHGTLWDCRDISR
jgi:hypothetical protein